MQTRRAYCAICLLNYSLDLILISWIFAHQTVLLYTLFCLSSALIGISITGLYLKRPSVMIPDILYKAIVSAISLFMAILDIDVGTSGASSRFILVAIALLTHIYENYFLFNAITACFLERNELQVRRPPPDYNLFAKEVTTTTTKKSKVSTPSSSEDVVTYDIEQPPPNYEEAVRKIREIV